MLGRNGVTVLPLFFLYNHSDVIVSSNGVQQGDPLGPFLFSLVLAPIVDEIQALSPNLNLWYLMMGSLWAVPSFCRKLGTSFVSKGLRLAFTPIPPSASGFG